jgi:hypothetical protein
MLKRIEFIRNDRRSNEPLVVSVVTDVSINPETAENRAASLFPAMRTKGATAFVIREADGPIIFRSHSVMPSGASARRSVRRTVPYRGASSRLSRF